MKRRPDRSRVGERLAPPMRARIEQALARNAVAEAAAMAERYLARGQVDPLLLNLAAWRREEDGDFAGAHALLQRAMALSPGDPMILGSLGAVLRKEGRLDEALAVLDRTVAAAPGHAAAWLERGYVLDALREWRDAAQSYRRALAVDPGLAPAHGRLADLAAKDGDAAAARAAAARALAIDPFEAAATCALASCDIEANRGTDARVRLKRLLDRGVQGDDRTRALTLLGDARDREGNVVGAFESYREAQANFRRIYAADLRPGPDRPSHRQFIEAVAARTTVPRPAPTPAAVPGEAARHVFLLGYPRSGTTLVENVLASAPDVAALEERDTLADADAALVPNSGEMPPLDDLDAQLVRRLREGYWHRVAFLGANAAGRTFVDMNPFNGIKLPVIARLFPDARILIMRRDPRDVVLSCFRINFTPSPAAWAFSDLKEVARHYDALMSLVERARERLPLAFHEVRYDKLVSDFEAEVRALSAFVGLPWTDAYRAFDRTARERGVRTASAAQVRRGLFDGRGQWRRYAAQLEPVLPILAPWIERFGFDP